MKAILGHDTDLMRLCSINVEPIVFVVYPEVQNPQFGVPNPNQFPEDNSNFEGPNWFTGQGSRSNDGGRAPQRNVLVETDSDGKADLDSSSDDDEDEDIPSTLTNCSLQDFAAWIRREGGVSQLMSLLVPVNHSRTNNETVYDNTEVASNWLLPIVPLDVSDSVAART